jgi:hypothetical protein
MACSCPGTLSAFDIPCESNTGGISKLYVVRYCDIQDATGVSGQITAVTMVGTTNFVEMAFQPLTGGVTEDATVNVQNGTTFFAPTVVGFIPKRRKEMKLAFELLQNQKLVAMYQDNNLKWWMAGMSPAGAGNTINGNGVYLTALGGGWGIQLADQNGYAFTLSGDQGFMAWEVDPTIVTALIS